MTSPELGFFGKLPAHGDFVARGWSSDVVSGLDAWFARGLAHARHAFGSEFEQVITTAPLWHCFLPAGWTAASAIHMILSPTVDRVGRYYLIAAGAADASGIAWALASQAPAFAEAVEEIVRQAISEQHSADDLVARLGAALPMLGPRQRVLAQMAAPDAAQFWIADPAVGAPVVVQAQQASARTLCRLLVGAS